MKDTLSGLSAVCGASLVRRLLHLHWRFSRGVTLGVSALVRDGGPGLSGQAFLCRPAGIFPAAVSRWARRCCARSDARIARGGQYRGRRARRACSRSISTAGYRGATMSRCLSWGFHAAVAAARQCRDHRSRLLFTGRFARGYHRRDPRAHRRSAGGETGSGTLVGISQSAPGHAAHRNRASARAARCGSD